MKLSLMKGMKFCICKFELFRVCGFAPLNWFVSSMLSMSKKEKEGLRLCKSAVNSAMWLWKTISERFKSYLDNVADTSIYNVGFAATLMNRSSLTWPRGSSSFCSSVPLVGPIYRRKMSNNNPMLCETSTALWARVLWEKHYLYWSI